MSDKNSLAMRILEELRQNPNRWATMTKQQVQEIMGKTGGFVFNYGRKYAISFRLACKAFSLFVLKQSGCKDGDYKVALVRASMVIPYNEWN